MCSDWFVVGLVCRGSAPASEARCAKRPDVLRSAPFIAASADVWPLTTAASLSLGAPSRVAASPHWKFEISSYFSVINFTQRAFLKRASAQYTICWSACLARCAPVRRRAVLRRSAPGQARRAAALLRRVVARARASGRQALVRRATRSSQHACSANLSAAAAVAARRSRRRRHAAAKAANGQSRQRCAATALKLATTCWRYAATTRHCPCRRRRRPAAAGALLRALRSALRSRWQIGKK